MLCACTLCSSLRELSAQALHNLTKRDVPYMKDQGTITSPKANLIEDLFLVCSIALFVAIGYDL